MLFTGLGEDNKHMKAALSLSFSSWMEHFVGRRVWILARLGVVLMEIRERHNGTLDAVIIKGRKLHGPYFVLDYRSECCLVTLVLSGSGLDSNSLTCSSYQE